jgi:hypothetical protein
MVIQFCKVRVSIVIQQMCLDSKRDLIFHAEDFRLSQHFHTNFGTGFVGGTMYTYFLVYEFGYSKAC